MKLDGKKGSVRVGVKIPFFGKETKIINWERDFFVHHRRVSAVKEGRIHW